MAKFIFATLLAFSLQTNSHAETDEKIFINADQMQLNINTGNSVYTGNVKITQGELELIGDKVTIYQSDDKLERMIVTGNPALYNHVTEAGETIKAESGQMVYTASKNQLVMTINAKLSQTDHIVSSQKIVYDTKNKIVIAGDLDGSPSGKSDESQRVNITLTPRKDPQQP